MTESINALHQIMRFNILKSTTEKEQKFTSAYIYAWQYSVYPAFDDGAQWHLPFPSSFKISEADVLEIGKFLDEIWISEKTISFYELEEHYGISDDIHSSGNWDRDKLVATCRYIYLNRMFDDGFWAALTEQTKCPREALLLCNPFEDEYIYFM